MLELAQRAVERAAVGHTGQRIALGEVHHLGDDLAVLAIAGGEQGLGAARTKPEMEHQRAQGHGQHQLGGDLGHMSRIGTAGLKL